MIYDTVLYSIYIHTQISSSTCLLISRDSHYHNCTVQYSTVSCHCTVPSFCRLYNTVNTVLPTVLSTQYKNSSTVLCHTVRVWQSQNKSTQRGADLTYHLSYHFIPRVRGRNDHDITSDTIISCHKMITVRHHLSCLSLSITHSLKPYSSKFQIIYCIIHCDTTIEPTTTQSYTIIFSFLNNTIYVFWPIFSPPYFYCNLCTWQYCTCIFSLENPHLKSHIILYHCAFKLLPMNTA